MTNAPYATLRRTLGPLIEPLYRFEINRRNARYDQLVGVKRLPLPVISVGNLTTGGTGKTPFVAWLCQQLLANGRKPLIAMRGYKASPSGHSDEATLYRALVPSVPVIADPRRYAAVTAWITANPGAADCVVLDDGFQHRKLWRDCDIVLLDATVDLTVERLLPTGNLREPTDSLKRATLMVLTHAEAAEHELQLGTHWSKRLLAMHHRALDATATHAWRGLRDALGVLHTPSHVHGRRILAVCAIGNPDAFVRQVQLASGDGGHVDSLVLPDHDRYSPASIQQIFQKAKTIDAEMIVTTAKDATKIGPGVIPAERWPVPLLVAELSLQIVGGEMLTAAVLKSLKAAGSQVP